MAQPVWALRDEAGRLLATVRAGDAVEARSQFRRLPEWARRGAAMVGRLDR